MVTAGWAGYAALGRVGWGGSVGRVGRADRVDKVDRGGREADRGASKRCEELEKVDGRPVEVDPCDAPSHPGKAKMVPT